MRILVVLSLLFLGASASAQQSIYVGLGLGHFSYEESTGNDAVGTLEDDASFTKLFGGFEINDNFTLEISYGKSGDLVDNRTGNVLVFVNDQPTVVPASVRFQTDFTITGLNAIGQVPFEWGAFMGGLGYHSSSGDFTDIITALDDGQEIRRRSSSISDNGLMAMLALEWRFGRFGARYGLRLEYEWWDISDVDASSIGIGLSYGF